MDSHGEGNSRMNRDRRAELIEAAFYLVAERGFEGLRLRDVAEVVGIDHSTMYHHIGSRQDLVLGVTKVATTRLSRTMPRDGGPSEQLSGHFDELIRMCVEEPNVLTVSAEIDLRARRDSAVEDSLDEAESGWRRALDAIFTRGNEGGAWARVDVEGSRELVIATVKGVRLRPDLAPAVLHQLKRALTET